MSFRISVHNLKILTMAFNVPIIRMTLVSFSFVPFFITLFIMPFCAWCGRWYFFEKWRSILVDTNVSRWSPENNSKWWIKSQPPCQLIKNALIKTSLKKVITSYFMVSHKHNGHLHTLTQGGYWIGMAPCMIFTILLIFFLQIL